jgi:hypothetical protein
MAKMSTDQILSIVQMVLQALAALQASGVLKHDATVTPGLASARLLLKDHFATPDAPEAKK